MTHIVLAPDSFKGTMSAEEVSDLMTQAIHHYIPHAEIDRFPLSDGGEGLVDALLRLQGGKRICCSVIGPNREPIEAFYGLLPSGEAVIEMAASSGLPLMHGCLDPLHATTYGVGQLLLDAVEKKASKILLGLGGSATNDGGIGMACALGWRFYNADGEEITEAGRLREISRIIPPKQRFPLPVTAACDVSNPLCGSEGATRIFGPQKGVTSELYPVLENGLLHLGQLLESLFGRPLLSVPGAGAAGGLGAGVLSFLNGELCPGIELLLDAAGFDKALEKAVLVLTGEGKLDGQSIHGKVPVGVARRCARKGVPCIALCGSLEGDLQPVYEAGITAAFAAVNRPCSWAEIQETCKQDFLQLAENVMRVWSSSVMKSMV